jgi:glycosyltransferase involved in cell wall biosynthesis
MTRVCHFTSIHSSGDTRIFVKECSSLAKAGYEVSLVSVNTSEIINNNVRIYNVKQSLKGRFIRMFFTTGKIYQKLLELNADIYHFHDPELIPYAKRLIRKGKKVIYDVHEDIPRQILGKYYLPVFLRKFISRVVEQIENNAASKFSWIITATPFIRERFLKFNSNVTAICNFPLLKELQSEVSYKSRPMHLCYIGSITEARGIKELIGAMETLPYTLHLCGQFSPLTLRDKLTNLPGWKNVKEHGYCSREQVKTILETSRVGMVTLYPIINYLDAYPVKMFEYMLAGIPVIATDIALWKKILVQAECGIAVDALNVEEIRSAIVQVMENPELSERMGVNGRKAIATSYNWNHEEQKLLDIYKKLSA